MGTSTQRGRLPGCQRGRPRQGPARPRRWAHGGEVTLGGSDASVPFPDRTSFAALLFKIDGPSAAHPFLFARTLAVEHPTATAIAANIYDLAEAENGDLIACGRFRNAERFEGEKARGGADNDGFVARFASDGRQVRWVKTFGGLLDEECTSVAVGPGNTIAIAANYKSSSLTFDAFTLPSPLPAAEWRSAHVLLDGDGHVVWVRAISGGPNRTRRVAFGENGDVYAAGLFTGSVDLGAGAVSSATRSFFLVRRSR